MILFSNRFWLESYPHLDILPMVIPRNAVYQKQIAYWEKRDFPILVSLEF